MIREQINCEEGKLTYDYKWKEKVASGTIFPVEYCFWPCGIIFEKMNVGIGFPGHIMFLPGTKSDAAFDSSTWNCAIDELDTVSEYSSTLVYRYLNCLLFIPPLLH